MRRFVVCVGYIVILMLFASCGRINEPARRGEGTLLTRADETPEITTEETPAPTPIPSPPAEPPVYIPYEPPPPPPP
ncbi:MAG: hypothetical protein FWC16_07545, partial [Defluviitaleaceae bacterium]|nr:hypothetical protein [Defluviitaleaceae bacterium]